MPRKQRAPWRPRRGLVPALLQHLVHGAPTPRTIGKRRKLDLENANSSENANIIVDRAVSAHGRQ